MEESAQADETENTEAKLTEMEFNEVLRMAERLCRSGQITTDRELFLPNRICRSASVLLAAKPSLPAAHQDASCLRNCAANAWAKAGVLIACVECEKPLEAEGAAEDEEPQHPPFQT